MIILTSVSTAATVASFILALIVKQTVSKLYKNKQIAKGNQIQQAGRDIINE